MTNKFLIWIINLSIFMACMPSTTNAKPDRWNNSSGTRCEKFYRTTTGSGENSSRGQFYQKYKHHLTFKNARRAFYAVTLATSIQSGIQVYPMAKYLIQSQFMSEDYLRQVQNKTFNPEKIRREQFQSYQEAFKAENGRWPNPEKHPEDAEEYYGTIERLKNTADEKLKF